MSRIQYPAQLRDYQGLVPPRSYGMMQAMQAAQQVHGVHGAPELCSDMEYSGIRAKLVMDSWTHCHNTWPSSHCLQKQTLAAH